MALIPELPVVLTDPELLVEATNPELPVDPTITRIRADLQATIRKTEIKVHPTMEIQTVQLKFWKLNSLISETRNATHCSVQKSVKTKYVRNVMDNIKLTIVHIISHMLKKTVSTVKILNILMRSVR